MKNDHLDKIKYKTNQMIGFVNYERNEEMKKVKFKHFMVCIIAVGVFMGGIFTVDALTDNAISKTVNDTIQNALKVKVNGKDYNAKCQMENDVMKCSIDSDALGEDTEVNIEKSVDADNESNKVEFEIITEESLQ